MTREEQRALLANFTNDVRDALLAHSDAWPEEWDGVELKWLVEKAFSQESPNHGPSRPDRKQRWRSFYNEWVTNNLY